MTFHKTIAAAALTTTLAFSGAAVSAATYTGAITGDPATATAGWSPNSTNALNYDKLVPGREGQTVPYVLFDSWGIGEVTLAFWNEASAGIAFFEYRLDGAPAGVNPHPNPNIAGDTTHPGVFLANGVAGFTETFFASQYVDVRLALGGERDWDFDWVRFHVQPIPVPAALPLLGGGLALLGFMGWRKRRAAA